MDDDLQIIWIFVFNISHIKVKSKLHVENQLPRCIGSGPGRWHFTCNLMWWHDKHLHLYIRSVADHTWLVLDSSLTEDQIMVIERIQKVAPRIILLEHYETNQNALNLTNLETLSSRQNLVFAQTCFKSENNVDMFPINTKTVNTR